MAKGAGMLAPGLATMLVVLTTDADVDAAGLDSALRAATRTTFDRIDSDGCMSTNDTVLLLASGASGTTPERAEFAEAVRTVCADLARQLIGDAEGASKDIRIEVVNAATEDDAVEVGRSIARNNLLKCAIHGEDPNWGRVLSAIGTTRAAFEPDQLNVAINDVWVCKNGGVGEDRDLVDMRYREVKITADLAMRHRVRRHLGQRPHRGLRPREQRVQLMTPARKHTALPKAQILIEALPWLTRHNGKTVVIKFGGNAMVDDELKAAFAQDVVFLRQAGLKPVVVHGGGPQISAQLDKQGLVSEFKAGLRVTTPEAMDVVRMVLAGQVQRELVGLLNQHGPLAVGLTGEDAHTITAVQHRPTIDGELVDIGRVGEITAIDTGAIQALLDDGRIPVVSSIARSADDNHVYNVNADTAAAALAAALDAETLMVLTDVEGLYEDWPHSDDVISRLTATELEKLLPELSSGMVPKMQGCLHAVRNGVETARVIDGRVQHSILLEIFTDEGIGTMVVPDAQGES